MMFRRITLPWFVLLLVVTPLQAGDPQSLPLIFVPGLKGSLLKDADNNLVWFTGAQALGLDNPALALPMDWRNGVQQRDAMRPAGVLDKVVLIPYLLEQPIYGPWLAAASASNDAFHAFAYDWRRDNLESLAELETFIDEVRSRHHVAKVRVVAHSMGGLLTLALLNRRPELFAGVAFVGVPFAGGIGFLPDLHAGTAAGLNHTILSPDVLFSFPSVYSLFPSDGSGLEDVDGNKLGMDFYAVSDWQRYRLGSLTTTHDAADLAERETHLHNALDAAKRFRALLRPQPMTCPPILVVAGGNLPTLASVRLNGPNSTRGVDFDTPAKLPGDGRVCLRDAKPPEGLPHQLLVVDGEHSQLLNDPAVIKQIDRFFGAGGMPATTRTK